jgi:DNA-binding Lrp family transcriptional regulator
MTTPRAFTRDLVLALMADGKHRTANEIADAIDRSERIVNNYLCRAREPGIDQQVHAVGRDRKFQATVYAIGKGENVMLRPPRPPRGKRKDVELSDKQMDAMHRRDNRRFPKVDPVLLKAINAMVRMGAAA